MTRAHLPLVMIWRRVSDLNAARATAEGMLHLPLIGQDDDSLMYDAGSVILGLWGQQEFTQVRAANEASLTGKDPVVAHNVMRNIVAGQCSAANFLKVDLVVNPASDVVFAVDDLLTPRARLREERPGMHLLTEKTQLGEALPFYDDDGNLYSMAQIADSATTTATGFAGVKLASVLKYRKPDETRMPLINLMVSDMAESSAFYGDVMELEHLQGLDGRTSFDLRTSILNLRPEVTPRVVRALQKSGRLTGDWFVFLTRDVAAEMTRMGRRGVTFPYGAEDSAIGRMAFFNDPNGYALVLWQPPTDESLPMKKINFFPVLNRILKEAT